MQHLKAIPIFLLLITILQSFSLGDPSKTAEATINMVDGSVKTGTIGLPFKLTASSFIIKMIDLKEKIDCQDVEKISFVSEGGFFYEYFNLKHSDGGSVKKKRKMMERVIPTGKVKMYKFSWAAAQGRAAYNMQALHSGGTSYYCQRDSEDFATLISLDDGNSVNRNSIFKKRAVEYFKDNAALVEKIRNKEYKFGDIYKVVTEYNAGSPE